MTTTKQMKATVSTGVGRQADEAVDVVVPDGGNGRGVGLVGYLTETVPVSSFTDGGGTSGTYQMAGSLPAGAVMLGSKVQVPAGFAGDTSAVLTVGDGSDVDRYNTGTPSVFTTAASGIEMGVPSGAKLVTTENRPTLTVTTGADFTACKTNGTGVVTVTLYYLQTA